MEAGRIFIKGIEVYRAYKKGEIVWHRKIPFFFSLGHLPIQSITAATAFLAQAIKLTNNQFIISGKTQIPMRAKQAARGQKEVIIGGPLVFDLIANESAIRYIPSLQIKGFDNFPLIANDSPKGYIATAITIPEIFWLIANEAARGWTKHGINFYLSIPLIANDSAKPTFFPKIFIINDTSLQGSRARKGYIRFSIQLLFKGSFRKSNSSLLRIEPLIGIISNNRFFAIKSVVSLVNNCFGFINTGALLDQQSFRLKIEFVNTAFSNSILINNSSILLKKLEKAQTLFDGLFRSVGATYSETKEITGPQSLVNLLNSASNKLNSHSFIKVNFNSDISLRPINKIPIEFHQSFGTVNKIDFRISEINFLKQFNIVDAKILTKLNNIVIYNFFVVPFILNTFKGKFSTTETIYLKNGRQNKNFISSSIISISSINKTSIKNIIGLTKNKIFLTVLSVYEAKLQKMIEMMNRLELTSGQIFDFSIDNILSFQFYNSISVSNLYSIKNRFVANHVIDGNLSTINGYKILLNSMIGSKNYTNLASNKQLNFVKIKSIINLLTYSIITTSGVIQKVDTKQNITSVARGSLRLEKTFGGLIEKINFENIGKLLSQNTIFINQKDRLSDISLTLLKNQQPYKIKFSYLQLSLLFETYIISGQIKEIDNQKIIQITSNIQSQLSFGEEGEFVWIYPVERDLDEDEQKENLFIEQVFRISHGYNMTKIR